MLILGIDDAGRGPLIGPLILAGVLADKNSETALKRLNVADSKILSHPERIRLSKLIKESVLTYHVVKSLPSEIDSAINSKLNLNTLEALKTAEIINEINSGKLKKEKIKVIVDCPSVNTSAWTRTLESFIEHKDNLKIVCEHKADANYPVVSAASILAKVAREEAVDSLKNKYGNIGSGYPSDPITKEFLKSQGSRLKDSGIFRKSWATWKALFPEKSQSTLEGF